MTKESWDEIISKDKIIYDQIIDEFQRNILCAELAAEKIKQIYDMGFEHGQKYVYFARSGFGQTEEEWQEQRKNTIISCNTSEGIKTFRIKEDNSWEEINDKDNPTRN